MAPLPGRGCPYTEQVFGDGGHSAAAGIAMSSMQAADDGYAGLGKISDDKQNATNRRRLKKLSDTVRDLRSCADTAT